jgi:DMSO/TMAO reductase YedYZ heme-binding membrane subunit
MIWKVLIFIVCFFIVVEVLHYSFELFSQRNYLFAVGALLAVLALYLFWRVLEWLAVTTFFNRKKEEPTEKPA